MKKIVYAYSNGKEAEHTKYISKRTIIKEAGNSKRVVIYECNEYDLEKRNYGILAGKIVGILMLK